MVAAFLSPAVVPAGDLDGGVVRELDEALRARELEVELADLLSDFIAEGGGGGGAGGPVVLPRGDWGDPLSIDCVLLLSPA